MDDNWLDLLNSDWHDHRGGGAEDRLESASWVRAFLAKWRLPESLAGEDGKRELRAIRTLLRRAVDAIVAGHPLSVDDLAGINKVLAAAPVRKHLEMEGSGYVVTLIPLEDGEPASLATIVARFAELLAGGTGGRLRLCANPDCAWVFVDESRNQARRWCDSSGCGNLMKVRRFRQRHREAAQAAGIRAERERNGSSAARSSSRGRARRRPPQLGR